MLHFNIHKEDRLSRARRATITLSRGAIETPAFMPVGTFGAVRTLDSADLIQAGAQIILANTYHLLLRPGKTVFEQLGGIHGFSNWQKPVLTDSGGFQIFCLPEHRKITPEGAHFQSYVDGKWFLLSPEKSIEMQTALNSDIMMVLDWCVDSTSSFDVTQAAMQTTHSWAIRSLAARTKPEQALFAIVQGGVHSELRKQSAEFLTQHPFDGFAIGGLAVGETKSEREDTTEFVTGLLPKDKPRYLMGVGTPEDLLEAIKRGVDIFDCVIPTMYAQRGSAFTSLGRLNLHNAEFRYSDEKLDPLCSCTVCQTYPRAYLHHLSKCKEPTGWRLLALHNVTYYLELMRQARLSLEQDRFASFYQSVRAGWQAVTERRQNLVSARLKTSNSKNESRLSETNPEPS